MGGVFKAVGKAVKGIFKGIGKVFKAVAKGVKKLFSSKFGKILLIAAAVFFGGAALGLWASPFGVSAGAATAGAGSTMAAEGVVGAAGAAGSAGAGAAFEGLGMIGASGATGATGASGFTAALGGGQLSSAAAPGFLAETATTAAGALTPSTISTAAANAAGIGGATAGEMLAPVVTAGVNSGGTVLAGANTGSWLLSTPIAKGIDAAGSIFGGVEGWMKAHPVLTQLGGNILSSVFGKEEKDPYSRIAEEKIEYEQWLRDNSTIAGIGYQGQGTPTDLSGFDQVVARHAPQTTGPIGQYIPSQQWTPRPYQPAQYKPLDPTQQSGGLLAKYYGNA